MITNKIKVNYSLYFQMIKLKELKFYYFQIKFLSILKA